MMLYISFNRAQDLFRLCSKIFWTLFEKCFDFARQLFRPCSRTSSTSTRGKLWQCTKLASSVLEVFLSELKVIASDQNQPRARARCMFQPFARIVTTVLKVWFEHARNLFWLFLRIASIMLKKCSIKIANCCILTWDLFQQCSRLFFLTVFEVCFNCSSKNCSNLCETCIVSVRDNLNRARGVDCARNKPKEHAREMFQPRTRFASTIR